MSTIGEVWGRLSAVCTLEFTSQSRSATGWSGAGSGTVVVSHDAPDVLVFKELGQWQQDGGREMRFTNVFRWTRMEARLHLEHLRFGANKPVFLFEMARGENGVWREDTPHPCRDDCYSATLTLEASQVRVQWSVNGPKRDESISYIYR